MWETWVRSLGWEDPLEKEMATHSSTLAWRIPWREEPGRLRSMGSQRVRHDWGTSFLHFTEQRTSFPQQVLLKLFQAICCPQPSHKRDCGWKFFRHEWHVWVSPTGKETWILSLDVSLCLQCPLSSLIAVGKTSKTMVNSSESGHPCLVLDFRGSAFNFSPLRIMFAVTF